MTVLCSLFDFFISSDHISIIKMNLSKCFIKNNVIFS